MVTGPLGYTGKLVCLPVWKGDNMIAVQDLRLVKEKKTILQVDKFQLAQGKTHAFIGPNGAGKSTLLKVLALLDKPTGGAVFFKGQPVTGKNALAIRRRMAVVFQESLLLNTTVFDNVALGLKLRGVKASEINSRVDYWLDRLGIAGLRKRTPVYLSGGEAQRVSLARAFVLEPEVIFLDEPFSALDFPTRIDLLEELGQLLQNTGATAVFVTHDFNEIPYLTDTVVVIDQGVIIYHGQLREILEGRVQNKAVQHLLRHFHRIELSKNAQSPGRF